MKRYDVIEVPYGWRVVEYNSNGTNFHRKLYKRRADALRRRDHLIASQREITACAEVRKRSRNRCECHGECGREHPERRCEWMHGAVILGMAGAVVLSIVPLDHNADNLDTNNLRAYCQMCKQYHDADERRTDALFDLRDCDA